MTARLFALLIAVLVLAGCSAALADGSLPLTVGDDGAEQRAALLARPGIGPWTAGYVAMRLLADPDVLLTGDLVIRAGAGLLGLPGRPTELERRSAAWRPFRSYAGMHLWKVALAEAARARAEAAGRRVAGKARSASAR